MERIEPRQKFPKNYDIIIIGAGVVGCLIARTLSRYKLKVLLIDQAYDIGTGASAANTAIVHSGHHPVTGSLKAALNSAGNPMWDNLSAELNFSFQRSGGYVVALAESELAELENLRQRARQNGVPIIEWLSGAEVRESEPFLNSEVKAALWIPSIGHCDPFGVVLAAAENAVLNGVDLMLETRFEEFLWEGTRIAGLKTNRGILGCQWAINAAGLHSDEVMHLAGLRPEFKITPVKGEYYVLDNTVKVTQKVIFPVPSPESKGIVVTHTSQGNIMIGPNAQETESREDLATTAGGLDRVWQGAARIIPGLSRASIIASFAGLRATGNAVCRTPGVDYSHDFVVETDPEKRLVNLGGIDSPGLTASPAIARRVVEILKEAGLKLEEKADWNPIRVARPRFRDLNKDERTSLIRRDPRYGRVVCRCETVTEAELIAEMRSAVPARSYDALKRRTWLGTGRCQGAFDIPRVIKGISDELGIKPEEVTKKGRGSELLTVNGPDSKDDAKG